MDFKFTFLRNLVFVSLLFFILSVPVSGQLTIFTEDFESVTPPALPSGWTTTNAMANTPDPADPAASDLFFTGTDVDANIGGFFNVAPHTVFAMANDDNCGSTCDMTEVRLILPSQDFTGMFDVNMDFAAWIDATYTDMLDVQVSTDMGTTWTTVSGTLTPTDAWQSLSADLSAYDDVADVIIAFLYNDGGSWGSGVAVDDVSIQAFLSSPICILTEDFEGITAPALPAGWTTTNPAANTPDPGDPAATDLFFTGTDVDANIGGFFNVGAHTVFAMANDDNCGSTCDMTEVRLILPPQDFTGVTDLDLEAEVWLDVTYTDMSEVQVSTDMGATWTTAGAYTPADAWVTTSISLTAYAGMTDVWISFLYNDGSSWGSGFAVDDICLLATYGTPTYDVTVTVDMSQETVDGGGVHIAGSFNGWTGELATDNADGTWSYTITGLASGTSIEYKWQNGLGNWENDLVGCGTGGNRSFTAGSMNESLPTTCYNSCTACPPPPFMCVEEINDDIESYSVGTIGPQAAHWDTWGFAPGGPEDGLVSTAQAASGVQSLEISDTDPDDVLLLLGDKTAGNWALKWRMYIPSGSAGYYNIQKFQNTPGAAGGFAMQISFAATGTATMDAGGAAATTFAFSHDVWFDVVHFIDIDNDRIILLIDGAEIFTWPFSWDTFTTGTGISQLGSIDFFGEAGDLYYIDDVVLKALNPCPANALICERFDAYDLGTNNAAASAPWMTTWGDAPGTGEDADISDEQSLSCDQSLKITAADPDDFIVLLGDSTSGNYKLEWDMYVPSGSAGYYNLQKFQDVPGMEFGMQVEFLATGTAELDAGGSNVVSWAWTADQWMHVEHYVDLDKNLITMFVDGDFIYQWPANWGTFATTGTLQLGAINFFGNTSVLQYIDNLMLLELPPSVDVTVTVDMSEETVAGDGVWIAGSFNGWTNVAATDNADGTWSYTMAGLNEGSEVQYKFQNGSGMFESGTNLAACGIDDGFGAFNRVLTAPAADASIATVCYDSCDPCPPPQGPCVVSIDDDIESYTLGSIGTQADHWNTWGMDPGGVEDGEVTDVQANSGTQSAVFSAAGGDDALLFLGDQTAGNWVVRWKMYIPSGSSGYYNIQKFQDMPGATGGFAMQLDFTAAGTANLDAGAADAAVFPYTQDAWMDIMHLIDIDNNLIILLIDGEEIYRWPFSATSFNAGTGIAQLGAINFFGNTGNLYYVDDVFFKQLEACPPNSLICETFDAYYTGVNSAATNAPWLSTWGDAPGTGEDADISDEQSLSCDRSMKVTASDPDDFIFKMGDRTTGNYMLRWDFYIPTGSAGYWNIQKIQDTPGTFGSQVELFAAGTGELDAGGSNIATFDFPHDQWFPVEMFYDLDNNWVILSVDGVEVYQWPASWATFAMAGPLQLGAINFFGNTNVLQYIDNVMLIGLPPAPANNCVSANDINPLFGAGVNLPQTSAITDNSNNSTTGADPTTGFECFGEPNGGGATPSLENTVWYTFTGDGSAYFIETVQCGATDYIDDGDTQIAIYSGNDCNNLTPVACNEDGPNATATEYPAGLDLVTEPGVVYWMIVDGFNFNGAISDGEFCVEVTQTTDIDINEVEFESGISLYPNPAFDYAILEYTFPETVDLTIEITNSIGQVVFETQKQGLLDGTIQLDLKNLASGMYFVTMRDGVNQFTERLIVQKP